MADELDRLRGGEGSKFNSAIADLERMHNLLLECNLYSRRGDDNNWCRALNALYREIATYLNPSEMTELQQYRVQAVPNDPKAKNLVRAKLDNFELKIREFRAKKKLGIVAGDDASTAALR